MLKAFLQRWRIRRTMEQYASPGIVRQVMDETPMAIPNPIERPIEFAFVALSASDAAGYSERVETVARIAMEHNGFVSSLAPIVAVSFGSVLAAPPDARIRFVSRVQSQLPESAAILHGSIIASVGSFGGSHMMSLGFWWPDMAEALRQLALLSPGDVRETGK